MSRLNCIIAALSLLICSSRAATQESLIAQFKIQVDAPGEAPICVPLIIDGKFAGLQGVTVEVPTITARGNWGTKCSAQLTSPGLVTVYLEPDRKGAVRRNLHFMFPLGYRGETIRVFAEELEPNKKNVFAWSLLPNQHSDLRFIDRPLLRYIHAPYDNSTPAKRDKTYKVFHHLFDPTGKRLLTNGGDTNDPLPKNPKDQLYPHHRGLMYAFNEITFDGNKKCDTWHAKPGDTHQSHQGFLVEEAGPVLGRHRVAVNWHGPKSEVFAKEEREVTVYKMDKGTLVDFVSRLKTTGGPVKLAGDPQHAGFQFRAHNDLHEQKNEKLTYFLRPDGKGKLGETRNWDPKTKKGPVNLPWDAMSFVIDGKRFTVAYLNHPSNPGESRWSERDYGRFGCYFEYELTEKNPLVVNYRIWLQEGEMTVDEVDALHRAFTQPPKVVEK